MTIELTGEVVRPGDSGYEAARIGWNRLYIVCLEDGKKFKSLKRHLRTQ